MVKCTYVWKEYSAFIYLKKKVAVLGSVTVTVCFLLSVAMIGNTAINHLVLPTHFFLCVRSEAFTWNSCHPEDGGSMFLQNVGTVNHCGVQKPKKEYHYFNAGNYLQCLADSCSWTDFQKCVSMWPIHMNLWTCQHVTIYMALWSQRKDHPIIIVVLRGQTYTAYNIM